MPAEPFVPPPYPYDRLDPLKAIAADHEGGIVDLSIGSPCDAPPQTVIDALGQSGTERSYPPSIGTPAFRTAAAEWLNRLVGTDLGAGDVRATIGSKEVVAGMPHWLRLRRPDLDTVLYPAISYPSYAMGATLAGCRAVAVPVDDQWRIDLSAIDPADAARALCLWVNTPGNPAGGLDDLDAAAAWGRANGVPVLSDECYIEFTWDGPPRSILEHGLDGVIAVHSLSKRSNLAGARAGFYAGDPDLLHYLGEVRKHAGFMPPGPVQAAAIAAFGDQAHVEEQKDRYCDRLERMQRLLGELGVEVDLPGGGFYLWAPAPDGDAWALTERLARDAGVLVSPGEFYGEKGAGHVRVAVVQPDDVLDLAFTRLGLA
ncbi:MAG: pyridoxal phosphate-dependent aminotransferase [Acidimicrobiales bacterium]